MSLKFSGLVTRMRSAATATAGINKFEFDVLSKINQDRGKSYPVILAKPVPSRYEEIHNDGQGDYKIYPIEVYCFANTYKRGAEKTVLLETVYESTEDLLRAWHTNFMAISANEYHMVDRTIQVEYGHFIHGDRLVGVKFTFDLRVFAGC